MSMLFVSSSQLPNFPNSVVMTGVAPGIRSEVLLIPSSICRRRGGIRLRLRQRDTSCMRLSSLEISGNSGNIAGGCTRTLATPISHSINLVSGNFSVARKGG